MHRLLGCIAGLVLALGACASPPTPPPVATQSAPVSSAGLTASASALAGPSPSPSPSPSLTSVPATPAPSGASVERFADGIPRAFDGEPVLRGKAALTRAAATTDTTPFLVGGWVTYEPGFRFCTAQIGDQPWSHDCVQASLSDVAGALAPTLTAAVTFHFVLADLATGPVVARVAVHDARSASCGTAAAVCDRMMVVQQVVWTGDAATAPRPISLDAALNALATVQPGATLVPGSSFCGDALPAAQVESVRVADTSPRAVTAVAVEPSSAARGRALPQRDGPEAAMRSSAVCSVVDGVRAYRWLIVANVVVTVRVHWPLTTADRAFVEHLAAALKAAASASP